MLERVGPDISFGKAGAGKESIYWASAKQRIQMLTMLAPAVSTFIRAESFELQTHIKSTLLFKDLLDSEIALVCRPGTRRKTSFPDESVQSLTLRYFSIRYPDEAALECSNLIVAVGLQEAGDDDCCLTW
jgi:hypothetical protein